MTDQPIEKRKLLFVDDELDVLSELQRVLRSARRDWDMSFVDSGEAALEELGCAEYDAVVSDLRMPGMDGAELLGHVRDRHPSTVRIIQSGRAELDSAMRSASTAHQFLAKPCEPDHLQAVVARSCALRASLEDPLLVAAVGGLDTLPALPRVYAKLVKAIANPDVSLDEVTEIVSTDPGIAVKILQLVNSSFFGIAREITSIRDAISFLGLGTIKALTLNHEIIQAFDATQAASGFDIEAVQAHALQVATVAQEMLDDKAQADLAFLGGALHDIGKLVLATTWKTQYEHVLRLTETSSRIPLHVLEKRALEVTHAEVGGYLLGIWGMPFPIVEAAHGHHSSESPPVEAGFDAVAAVRVADTLVHEIAGCTKFALDLTYLEAVGVADRIEDWRTIARAVVGDGHSEAA